jgi:hypothetical protein
MKNPNERALYHHNNNLVEKLIYSLRLASVVGEFLESGK